MTSSHQLKIAILNTNEDILEAMEHAFRDFGVAVASLFMTDVKRGRVDFIEFIKTHDPDVVIYDIPPPYKENVTLLTLLRHLDVMKGRPIVLTTTNVALLKKEHPELEALEIVGKPFDLNLIAETAIKAAKKRRP